MPNCNKHCKLRTRLFTAFALLAFLAITSTASTKQTDKLWCLKATLPQNLHAIAHTYRSTNNSPIYNPDTLNTVNMTAPFTEFITYHQSHCNILCNASRSCDMFTYYHNYTCQLYSYAGINATLSNTAFTLDMHDQTWATCIMSNIEAMSQLIGKRVALHLSLSNSYCVMHYNTLGANIQQVPPEPPFSPSNISTCWKACTSSPQCTHTVFQPKYKEMTVSACWLKTNYSRGSYGMNDVDEMTQASCFKNAKDFFALGIDSSYEFMYIPPSSSSASKSVRVKALQTVQAFQAFITLLAIMTHVLDMYLF